MTGERCREPVAIVTGGGSGIGAATARALAGLGWAIALVGRRSELLAEVARSIEAVGVPALAITADMAKIEDVPVIIDAVGARFGRVDALVNNAGRMDIVPFAEATPAQFDGTFATNLRGPYFLSQAALPLLRAAEAGSVVNIGSAAASLYRPGQSIYGSSKAALEYLTKSLAIELAPDRIRVNAIIPGPVETAIHERPGVDQDAVLRSLERAVPLGRIGTPDEIAWWVAKLTAPEAGWVTGAVIHIDGGRILAPPESPL